MARIQAVVTYGDCPTHGEAITDVFRSSLDDGTAATMCALCAKQRRTRDDGMPSFVKVVLTNLRKITCVERGMQTSKPCNAKCTSGKTSCDCRCKGRCHGAGKCYGGH